MLPLLCSLALAASPEDVLPLLQPWQQLDTALVERATVAFAGPYSREEQHMVRLGLRVTALRARIAPGQVLDGKLAPVPVDLDLLTEGSGPRPPYYVEGRTYLVLLRPTKDTARLLKKGETTLDDRVSADEIVAILDLSMSEEEADSLVAEASRSSEWRGSSIAPETWAALRAKGDPDPLRAALPVLIQQVLVPGTPYTDVQAWLGTPDVLWSPTRVEYTLGTARPREDDGATWSSLALFLDEEGLERWELRQLRRELRPGVNALQPTSASVILSPHQALKAGLPLASGPQEGPPWTRGGGPLVRMEGVEVPDGTYKEVVLLPFDVDLEPVEAWRYDLCVEAEQCAPRTLDQPGPAWQPAVGMPWEAANTYCATRGMAAQSSQQAMALGMDGVHAGPDLLDDGPKDVVRAGFRCTVVRP